MQPIRTIRNGVQSMDQAQQPIRRRSTEERTAYIEGWKACLNVCKNKGVHMAELSLGVMGAANQLDVSPTTKEAPMESEDQVEDNGDEETSDVEDAASGAAEGAVEGAQDDDSDGDDE